jgi:hypothetical protein
MNENPKALFEDAVQRLDLGAANRLRQARRAALGGESAAPLRRRTWLPVVAAAAGLLLGLAWWMPRGAPPPAPAPTPVAASPAASEDGSLLAEDGEDADFYAWLAEAPVAAEADKPEQRL